MWFVYTLLIVGAVASVLNLLLVIPMAMLAVKITQFLRRARRKLKRVKKPKRRRGQMLPGSDLIEVQTSQIPYDTPVDVVRGGPKA
ncbi:MAG: hypothetical protein ACREGR_00695 [Minisyncoccia bacterium]